MKLFFRIIKFYESDDSPILFLLINNIESGGLSKAIYVLTKLVQLPKIKLICSIDKVYGPFVLDQNQFTSFNFLTFDVATFAPYFVETRQAGNLFAKGSSQVGKLLGKILRLLCLGIDWDGRFLVDK